MAAESTSLRCPHDGGDKGRQVSTTPHLLRHAGENDNGFMEGKNESAEV